MRRLTRDRLLFWLLCGGTLAIGCTRLTSIDWSLIPAGSSAGTSTGAMGGEGEPMGGEAGAPSTGALAGAAGEPAGGAGGEAGEEDTGNAGTAGFGGFGGFGGNTGGGAGGGGMGGMGGTAGSAGTAGTGGNETVIFPPCTGTPSTVQPGDVVMFDGGTGTKGLVWGGRTGLDNICKAALSKLSLPQTTTHAFISASQTDSLWGLTTTFPDIPAGARVVGPTGITLQTTFADLRQGHLLQSFVCADVLPMTTTRWLTGSSLQCTGATMSDCGQYASDDESCKGWTSGTYSAEVQARYGSSRMITSIGTKSWFSWLKIDCDAAGAEHIVCFAYKP